MTIDGRRSPGGSITRARLRGERNVGGQPDGSLAAEGTELVHVLGAVGVLRVGTPPRAWHYTGVDQFQAGEEPGDLLRGAQGVGGRGDLVPLPYPLAHPLAATLAG